VQPARAWARLSPRWEPCALGARARVCAGSGLTAVPTATGVETLKKVICKLLIPFVPPGDFLALMTAPALSVTRLDALSRL
jgi:hypothetical protein